MNTHLFTNRKLSLVILWVAFFLITLAIAIPSSGKTYAQKVPTANPRIVASITWYWFRAVDFTPNDTVNIQIYDSQGGSLVWEGARMTDETGYVHIGSWEHPAIFAPGTFIVISDTLTTKELVLEDITLDVFDPDLDYLAGTAPPAPGGRTVWVGTGNEYYGCSMFVTADEVTGDWEADFASAPEPCDVTADMWAAAQIFDADSDASEANPTPYPFMVVFPEAEWYDGWNWPEGAVVTITVTDKPECETSEQSYRYFFNGNFPGGCDLEIGDEVSFTDGETIRTHTAKNLAVTEIDDVADTVAGTADPGELVYVWPHETGEAIQVTATITGTWLADFSGIYDIVPGTAGRSQIYDTAGNATAVDWWLRNPHFIVFPEWDWFDGLNWPDGATVSITVDTKPECTTSKESWEFFFNGNFPEGCDLEIGDEVTFTDGETIRTHTVRNLAATEIDDVADTVAGTSDPGELVYVWLYETGESVEVTTTITGTWLADFSGIYDIRPGTGGRAQISDEAENSTSVEWFIYYEGYLPVITKGE